MTSDPLARYLSEHAVKIERRARLRPMNGGEVSDLALRVYRNLGWPFLRLTVLPSLFCLAAIAFTMSYGFPAIASTQNPDSVLMQIAEAATAMALTFLVAGPLFLIGLTYTSSLVVRMVSDYLIGNRVSEIQGQRDAASGLGKMLLVMFLELLQAFGGVILASLLMFAGGLLATVTSEESALSGVVAILGVGGIFLGFLWFLHVAATHALVVPIAIIENAGARVAGKRSKSLMKNARYHGSGTDKVWSLYALLFLTSLILWGGSEMIMDLAGLRMVLEDATMGLPLQGLFLRTLDLFPAFLMVWALVPVWATAITVIYYERRTRLEGYDIEILASEIRAR